jgi:hypothetical protein
MPFGGPSRNGITPGPARAAGYASRMSDYSERVLEDILETTQEFM